MITVVKYNTIMTFAVYKLTLQQKMLDMNEASKFFYVRKEQVIELEINAFIEKRAFSERNFIFSCFVIFLSIAIALINSWKYNKENY